MPLPSPNSNTHTEGHTQRALAGTSFSSCRWKHQHVEVHARVPHHPPGPPLRHPPPPPRACTLQPPPSQIPSTPPHSAPAPTCTYPRARSLQPPPTPPPPRGARRYPAASGSCTDTGSLYCSSDPYLSPPRQRIRVGGRGRRRQRRRRQRGRSGRPVPPHIDRLRQRIRVAAALGLRLGSAARCPARLAVPGGSRMARRLVIKICGLLSARRAKSKHFASKRLIFGKSGPD